VVVISLASDQRWTPDGLVLRLETGATFANTWFHVRRMRGGIAAATPAAESSAAPWLV